LIERGIKMKAKNIVFTILIVTLFGTMLFAVGGVKEAQANPAPPTIYMDNVASRTTALFTTPYIWPRPASAPATKIFYIRIARAPRENTAENPAAATDKTRSWQVRLRYDPNYFSIVADSDIAEKNFLKRNKYEWIDPDPETPDDEYWSLAGTFSSTFMYKYNNTLGTVLLSSVIWAPTPDKTPLPAEYNNGYAPDKNRHGGSYYDLPYTENLTQSVLQPSGPLGEPVTVIDPNYNTLVSVKITMHTLPPEGYTYAFHLYDTVLWCYDGSTTYAHTTVDAYFAGIAVPEFPLGLSFMILLAPLIPIIYLWRTRSKKKVA
jgi:hypothetical protein